MAIENNIPKGWIENTLGDMVRSANTGLDAIKRAPIVEQETGIKCFRIQDASQKKKYNNWGNTKVEDRNFEKFQLKKGDILIARTGNTIGVHFLVKKDLNSVYNNGIIRLRVNSQCDFNYLYKVIESKRFSRYVQSIAYGTSTQPNMQINVLLGYEFTAPPLPEQKAIAKVLTAFDDKIELLQNQNKTLETMAQTIFKEWFGKYQIGDELPVGWRVGKINEFVKSSIGGDYGKEVTEGDYIEKTICLRGTDLPDMKIGAPEKAPIRFLKASKLEKCKLENGDIVVEISGGTENQSTGRAMYINEKIISSANYPMTCVNFCRIIRPLKVEYSYFLYGLFDYLYSRKVFFNWENGTTGIKNLNLKALLEDFDLFIPENIESILDFSNTVQAIFNKIQTNNSQIQSLTKTRDTLLPKLISGQVRVNNIKQPTDA